MPYRAYHLVLGIFGVAAVAVLLIFGANVERHSRSGPRWKQRLLAAGVLLLAALGLGPACQSGPAPKTSSSKAGTGGTSTDQPSQQAHGMRPAVRPGGSGMAPTKAAGRDTTLTRTTEWTQITRVTGEAEAIVANKRGAYPFNRAGKKKLLSGLQTAQANADALAKRQLITPGEAGLLKQDLQTLRAKVSAFRATEMRNATCYEPMPLIAPAAHSLKRLRVRLPILKKLAAAKRLHPRVLTKVLAKVEADVALLENPDEQKRLSPTERPKAAKLAADARAQLVKIKARLKRAATPKGK